MRRLDEIYGSFKGLLWKDWQVFCGTFVARALTFDEETVHVKN